MGWDWWVAATKCHCFVPRRAEGNQEEWDTSCGIALLSRLVPEDGERRENLPPEPCVAHLWLVVGRGRITGKTEPCQQQHDVQGLFAEALALPKGSRAAKTKSEHSFQEQERQIATQPGSRRFCKSRVACFWNLSKINTQISMS